MKRIALSIALGLIAAAASHGGGASAKGPDTKTVVCPGDSIQEQVDRSDGPTVIVVSGLCSEDVTIDKDDITLSGNREGGECHEAEPGLVAGATIDGTITVDGVRARVEFLGVTGAGDGVSVVNRADAKLTCNDIFDNQGSGVTVSRASNAVLRHNRVRGNGRRSFDNPFVYFDVGLFVADAASVWSLGNTYENNQYAAVEVDRQGSFRNGSFLPRAGGLASVDPEEKDVFVQKGADPENPDSCKTSAGPVAIEIFNDGLVDLRNADVCGQIETAADSSFRVDDAGGAIVGNILNVSGSQVRIRDRSGFGGGRLTTFDGTLSCFDTSQTFSSTDVRCGQTCSGPIPGSCVP